MRFFLLFTILFSLSTIINIQVGAQTSITCNIVDCPDVNGDGKKNDFEPDFECILSKRLNTPTSVRPDCCENKCKGENDSAGLIDGSGGALSEEFRNFTIFNTRVKISYDKIPTIINLLFSTLLGVYSIYAIIRGIYIYGIKLPNTTKAEELESVNKEGTAIITGFIIALAFLFITQIVFSILGLPALNEINLTFEPGAEVEGPGITIQ